MKIVFLNLATAHEEWADQAQELYLKKLSHFIQVEVKSLKPTKLGRDSASEKRQSEGKLILATLEPSDLVILLDEKGVSFSSREFSKKLEQWIGTGKKRLVFLIGGAYGVSDEVKARADHKLSLSTFVFNHMLAQTVILEQVYRAFTIQKNLPYHND